MEETEIPQWRLLLFVFIAGGVLFREISKKLNIDNKIISGVGAIIFCFILFHFKDESILRKSIKMLRPFLLGILPTLTFISYTFNIRFERFEKIFRNVIKFFISELVTFAFNWALVGYVFKVDYLKPIVRMSFSLIFTSTISGIRIEQSSLPIHVATIKYTRLLLILVVYSFTFADYDIESSSIPSFMSLGIDFVNAYEIFLGLLLGICMGGMASLWSRKVIRDNQMFLLLSSGSLLFLSLICYRFDLHHAYYPSYCGFCVTFRNLGFSKYKIKEGENILWDITQFLDSFVENCLFFLFGILFTLSLKAEDYSKDEGFFTIIAKVLMIYTGVQVLRFFTIYIGKSLFLSNLSSKEKMNKSEILAIVLSEKYSNFSMIIMMVFWEHSDLIKQDDFVLVSMVVVGHSILQESLFLLYRLFYDKENKILRKEGKFELNLKLGIVKSMIVAVAERWNFMKSQGWNSQISTDIVLNASGILKDAIKADKYVSKIFRLGMKETKALELEMLSDQRIVYKEERWKVFMLMKSFLWEYNEIGVLSSQSFDLLSDACDKAAENTKERVFWATVINNIPSISYLKKLERTYEFFGKPSLLKSYLIGKLAQAFEVSMVIEKCIEDVTADKKFISSANFSSDKIMEEFESILEGSHDYMRDVEIHFCSFTRSVRSKRASVELLSFKLEKFKELAKKRGLKNEYTSTGCQQILKDLNRLEDNIFEETEESPIDFLINSQLFGCLSDKILCHYYDNIIQRNMLGDEFIYQYNDEFRGIYIVKSGVLSITKGQKETCLRVGDIVALDESFSYLAKTAIKEINDRGKIKYQVKSITPASLIFVDAHIIGKIGMREKQFFNNFVKIYFQRSVFKTNKLASIKAIFDCKILVLMKDQATTMERGGYLLYGGVSLEIKKEETFQHLERSWELPQEIEPIAGRLLIADKPSIIVIYSEGFPSEYKSKEMNINESDVSGADEINIYEKIMQSISRR